MQMLSQTFFHDLRAGAGVLFRILVDVLCVLTAFLFAWMVAVDHSAGFLLSQFHITLVISLCLGIFVVAFYGAAGMHWVDFKIRDLQKAAGYRDSKPIPVSAVYLAPPFNRRKERFRSVSTEALKQTGDQFDPGLLADFVETIKQSKEAK